MAISQTAWCDKRLRLDGIRTIAHHSRVRSSRSQSGIVQLDESRWSPSNLEMEIVLPSSLKLPVGLADLLPFMSISAAWTVASLARGEPAVVHATASVHASRWRWRRSGSYVSPAAMSG